MFEEGTEESSAEGKCPVAGRGREGGEGKGSGDGKGGGKDPLKFSSYAWSLFNLLSGGCALCRR